MVVGVWTILTPASALPLASATTPRAQRSCWAFGSDLGALGMFFVCCVAIAVAQAAATGGCTAGSDNVRCSFEAAEPLLVFAYFIGPTPAGAPLSSVLRLSPRAAAQAARRGFAPSRERGATLVLGQTLCVALASATAAFIAFALIRHQGTSLFLPAVAACVAFGLSPSYLSPSYDSDVNRMAAPTVDAPTW